MDIVYNIVVVLHFVGLALLLGAFLVQLTAKEKTVTRWMFDGAMTQLRSAAAGSRLRRRCGWSSAC